MSKSNYVKPARGANRTKSLIALAAGMCVAGIATAQTDSAQTDSTQALERVEVTGSRIKRVDAEGALPVTTFTRADLQASGATTIAEFVRSIPFAQAGNFRPQSGSSAAGFASVDLRGLGSQRTLVLLDGKRLPKAAQVGDSVDMNSIPMAAIERVEVLTDGASAIYGSDAIGGVINFITRKDMNGAEVSVGYTNPITDGGSKRELSATIGMSNEKGNIIGGFSRTQRGMVFTRQRPWGATPTKNGGNYAIVYSDYSYHKIPGKDGTCEGLGPGFFTNTGDGRFADGTNCVYNASSVNADEQQITTDAMFVRGEYNFAPDWSVFVNTSVSKVDSFGRYAPAIGGFALAGTAAGNPFGEDIYLLHRFAAAGNRDDYATSSTYDFDGGVKGRLFDKVDVTFGLRKSQSTFKSLGYNYIVAPLAAQAIANGTYDITDPYATDPDVLNSIKATISRNGKFDVSQAYGDATMSLFKMAGGDAAVSVNGEYREEKFFDQYDSLSEAGVILGSAGNSSAGNRYVGALGGELYFPFTKALDLSLSARYETYSDYGSNFAPKASIKFKALPNLALRGSVGTGFMAPAMSIKGAKTAFSAESIADPRTCAVTNACDSSGKMQRNTYVIGNPELSAEKSHQFSFGALWDVTSSLSLSADYWSVKIKDTIGQVTAQDIVDRDNGDDPRAIPPGLGVVRDPATGVIKEIYAGYANEGTLKATGLDLKLDYRWRASFGKFHHNLVWSHQFKYETDGSELSGSQGQPKDRATLTSGWSAGPLDLTWNVNYIGKNGHVEDKNATGAYVTHDLQLNYSPSFIKGSRFTVGVLNVGNKMPELITYDGRNFNFYLYDSYGRQPYVRYTQAF